MKFRSHRHRQRGRKWAITLPETMVTMALFSLIVLGTVGANLFGSRMYQITKAKLGASDEARRAINLLKEEIHSAKYVRVGNGDLNGFTNIPIGSLQEGNALQIHSTTNQANFIRYYWDSSDRTLKRTTDGATALRVVANHIDNSVVFRAEDHHGNTLTNNQNNRVVSMKLEFYQIQYPVVQIGDGGLFDYYKLETRMTRRVLE